MCDVLTVEGLTKTYPAFQLRQVSFSLSEGSIMGFIGRNGAGKTTTLKSLLNLVHPDSGEIRFFGMDWSREREIKQCIGFASGGVCYYPRKPISQLIRTTAQFYPNWDVTACNRYMAQFALDESKCPRELSEGMKVKLNLTLALSHHARLLILDEPTSGLDPVSRAELLTIFERLAGEGIAILFSTHITSDLDKCADHITYIKQGRIVGSSARDTFISQFGGGNLEDIMLRIEQEAESYADPTK